MKYLCVPAVLSLTLLAGCATRAIPVTPAADQPRAEQPKKPSLPVSIALTKPLSVEYAVFFSPDKDSQSRKAYGIVKAVRVKATSEELRQSNTLVLLLDGRTPVRLDAIRIASIDSSPARTRIAAETTTGQHLQAKTAELFLCQDEGGKFVSNRCQPVMSVFGNDVCIEASTAQAYRNCSPESSRLSLFSERAGGTSAGLGFASPQTNPPSGIFKGIYKLLSERERDDIHQRLPQIYDQIDLAQRQRDAAENAALEAARIESGKRLTAAMEQQAKNLPSLPVGSTDSCVMDSFLPRGSAYTDKEKFSCGRLGRSLWLGALRKAGWEIQQETRAPVLDADDREMPLRDRTTVVIRKERK